MDKKSLSHKSSSLLEVEVGGCSWNGGMADSGDEDESLRSEKQADYVQCNWPNDMWDTEYNSFVIDGLEYSTTPDFDEMITTNPDLYGMVTCSLQRYCKEHGIDGEMFYFEFPKDRVSNVTCFMR